MEKKGTYNKINRERKIERGGREIEGQNEKQKEREGKVREVRDR